MAISPRLVNTEHFPQSHCSSNLVAELTGNTPPSTQQKKPQVSVHLSAGYPSGAKAHAGAAPRGRLIPVTEWNAHHSWPPIGGLRHLIFHADANGFNQVIRRVGRRVLIDEAAFFAWANSNGGVQ